MVLERLANKLGVRGDEPNIKLAREIAAESNTAAVNELINGLSDGEKAVRSDCIKTLYEIGYLKPELITGHTAVFLSLLSSRDNRLVWGAMIALSITAKLNPDPILNRIDQIYAAIQSGSVITVDNGVKTFAAIAAARPDSSAGIFPFLIHHLRTCRASQTPQHAESVFVAVNADNRDEFLSALRFREQDMTPAQLNRIRSVIRRTEQIKV